MRHNAALRLPLWILTAAITGLAPAAGAQALGPYELGLRADVNAGNGEPANDIPGFSLVGRYRVDAKWLVGLAVEHSPIFDVERPYELIGLTSPEEVDAEATSIMLSLWAERRYGEPDGGVYWYWTAGIGVNSVDVDELRGETRDGAPFDITIDADTETVITLTLGRRHAVGKRWLIGYGARIEERLTDWHLRDRLSGEEDTLEDYTVHGVFGDVTYRF